MQRIMGKCARISYVVPDAGPFVKAFWGAYSGATSAARQHGHLEAPPGFLPTRRFRHSAAWLLGLLSPLDGRPLLRLVRTVRISVEPESPPAAFIEFDASPWGGGGLLRVAGRPLAWFAVQWEASDAEVLGFQIGVPASQTFLEYLTMFLALAIWAPTFVQDGVALLGDNIAALEGALNLGGSRELTRITRELTCRRSRGAWRYVCGHLPAEANLSADALSRLGAPKPSIIPQELSEVPRVQLPAPRSFFATLGEPPLSAWQDEAL